MRCCNFSRFPSPQRSFIYLQDLGKLRYGHTKMFPQFSQFAHLLTFPKDATSIALRLCSAI